MNAAFLEWAAPPNRASAAAAPFSPIQFTVTSDRSDDVYAAFARFANDLRGRRDTRAGGASVEKIATLHSQIVPVEADRLGLAILRQWLAAVAQAKSGPGAQHCRCEIVTQFEPGGFFLIWFDLVDGYDADPEGRPPVLRPDRLKNVALALANLVKVAVNPDAAIIGAPRLLRLPEATLDVTDGRPREVFEVTPTTLEPVRIVTSRLDRGVALYPRVLGTLRKDFAREPATVFDSDLAVVQLGARAGQVLDENLPFVGDSGDDKPHIVAGFGEKAIRSMSLAFNQTSLALTGLFLALVFSTTISQSVASHLPNSAAEWLAGHGIERGEFMALSTVFFIMCVFRVIAVYGVETLIGDGSEERRGWFARISKVSGHAYFSNGLNLCLDVAVLFGVWVCLLLTTQKDWWFGIDSPRSVVGNQTMAEVITGFVWAMPAIGIGLLAHSSNKFSTISEAHNDNRRALDILSELGRIAGSAHLYLDHLQAIAPGVPSIASVRARLEGSSAAIERAKERVNAAMETRRRRFVRASAVTAALIGFVGAIGQISALKPDEIKTNHPIKIMERMFSDPDDAKSAAAFPDNHEVLPAGLNPAAIVAPDGGTEGSLPDACDPANFRQLLKTFAPPDGNSADAGAESEHLDATEELFALAIGHLIYCQQSLAKRVATPIDPRLLAPQDLRRLLEGIAAGEEAYLRIPARVAIDDAYFADPAATARNLDRQLQDLDLGLVPVTPGLAPASAAALDRQLQDLELGPVPVTPDLAPASAAALDRQLRDLDLGPVPVTPGLAPASADTLDRQLQDLDLGPVPVTAGLVPASADALDRQLQDLDLGPVPVTPGLAPASADALDRQLQDLDLSPVNVPVTPQLDPEAAERLGRQLDVIDPLPVHAAPLLVPDAARNLEEQLDTLKGENGEPVRFRSGIDLVPSEKLIAILEETLATVTHDRIDRLSPGRPAASPFPPVPGECLAHPLASFYFAQSGRTPAEVVCADIGDDRSCLAALRDPQLEPEPTTAGPALGALADRVDATRESLLAPGSAEQLLVVGYTDSTGDVGVNLGVARDRASGIARALGDVLAPELGRVRMSAIWRGEEVNSVEHPAGVPLRNPSSRRADVFHCIPES